MVRLAEVKDLTAVNALRRHVNELHCQGRPDYFKPGFPEKLQDDALGMMENENSDILVVERAGEIVEIACVEYVEKKESPYRFAQVFYHISEICVDTERRRQGVATEQMDFVRRDAKDKG